MPVVVVCKVQRQKKAEFSSCELHFGLPQLTLTLNFTLILLTFHQCKSLYYF